MYNGTVNWLNNAKPVNTFDDERGFPSIRGYNENVTKVTTIDDAWVKNAVNENEKMSNKRIINKPLNITI